MFETREGVSLLVKSLKYMIGKASFSSLTGWPIAFAANILVLPFFIPMLQENPLLAAVTIGVIFGCISIVRLFIIDYVEDRHGLNIRPDNLLKKAFRK